MSGVNGSTSLAGNTMGDGAPARRRLELRGRVQGVGFRPWIYQLATAHGLAGHVGNSPQGAFIEVEGAVGRIAGFRESIHQNAPPLVSIATMDEIEIPSLGEAEFRIIASSRAGVQTAEISPDVATCPDCLRELLDPADRRHRYPFINCTNCGPRYSIIRTLPYDRPATTMAPFIMCSDCQTEYDNPADRRFHAQPNACPRCGPRLWLCDSAGLIVGEDPIAAAAALLAEEKILAIKGIGGFHLVCRADSDAAVAALRGRKARESKPLAIMAPTIESAHALVHLDRAAAKILTSLARPILLAPARSDANVSQHVAPGTNALGVMLPYTPLHTLLFAEGLGPLVMTSGNPSAEPLCRDNSEARRRLAGIADAWLCHDREIERRVDDSVVVGLALPEEGVALPKLMPIRRARGYAPEPLRLTQPSPEPVLALGGELKSAICLLAGETAVLGEHLGELDNPAAYRNFLQTTEHCARLLDIEPKQIACDMHPDYAATRHARELGLPCTEVQHHHAHIVSCMAENGLVGELIGLACDGTGYGDDGTIWGCELLVCDEADYRRAGHLRPFPLLGGDAAARETWRPAAGLLAATYGSDWRAACPDLFCEVPEDALAMAERLIAVPDGPVLQTSSLGRLFDGVAFLLGLCGENLHEARAAIALEAAAGSAAEAAALEWELTRNEAGRIEIDPGPMIRQILAERSAGGDSKQLARAFHETVAEMLAAAAGEAAKETGLKRVALSGGCFANGLLSVRIWHHLRRRGLEVFIHERVPTGDGGLALGQAVVAAARLRRE